MIFFFFFLFGKFYILSLNVEVFKILKTEQHNKWIWEGMNLWIFIEVWQKVHLIPGDRVWGKGIPTLLSSQLGTDHRPLSKQPTVMSFTPRTEHKQIYIRLWYQKRLMKTLLST